MEGFKEVTIDSIANGAVTQQFDYALAKVLKNIEDPNTPAKDAREITIKIKLVPDDTRTLVIANVKVTEKLAGLLSTQSPLYLMQEGGKTKALERKERQPELFGANVTSIGKKE